MSKLLRMGLFYIVGGNNYGESTVFEAAGFDRSRTLEEADILVFTGGADIHPSLYNEQPIPGCYYSRRRDEEEVAAAEEGMRQGKFLAGICRGGQLLNVLSGGRMWQNVDNHHGTHRITDLITGQTEVTSSVHHQMMIPGAQGEVIAVAHNLSSRRQRDGEETRGFQDDPEVIWYPHTRSLCFQGHPEFGPEPCTDYFFRLVDRYLNLETERQVA